MIESFRKSAADFVCGGQGNFEKRLERFMTWLKTGGKNWGFELLRDFLRLPPPWQIFYMLGSWLSLTCHSNMYKCISHTNSYCAFISQEVDFKGDSTVKSPCWRRVSNQWPSNPDLLRFSAIPSLQHLAIFMAPHGRAHLIGQYSEVPLCKQLPASCPEHSHDFSRACTLWNSLPPIWLAYMLPQLSPALDGECS